MDSLGYIIAWAAPAITWCRTCWKLDARNARHEQAIDIICVLANHELQKARKDISGAWWVNYDQHEYWHRDYTGSIMV